MAWALSGIMAGAVGWLLFLAAHAFLITSIWDRAFTWLPFAALAGLTLACAMRSFEIRSLKGSIGFGVLVWALLLPPTAVASTGRHRHNASSAIRGRPSERDGRTRMLDSSSARAISSGTRSGSHEVCRGSSWTSIDSIARACHGGANTCQ